MGYLDKVERVIKYIEENLTLKIDLEEVAERACFSLYHFHKVFHAITQTTIKEYIRKRRLTEAALELINTEKRIIDIAFDYQYQSQEAFTRAFKELFGTTPARYRRRKEHYIMLQREELTVNRLKHLNGGMTLTPKIVNKDEFMIIGVEYYGTNQNNEIAELWGDFSKRIPEIKNIVNPGTNLGVCEHVPGLTDDSSFSYIICVEVDSLVEIPHGMVGKKIAAQQYAVFTHKGSADSLNETYQYIYGNWFLKSDYERTEDPDFELYDKRFTNAEDSEMDIYIPIRRLKKM